MNGNIYIKLNQTNYEYDVHSLVKAFWPEEQVSVLTPETKEQKYAELAEYIQVEVELSEDGAKVYAGGRDHVWSYSAGSEKSYKDAFKSFFYQTLCQVTGKELPWGNLIGIRPTKIAYGMLEDGKSQEEIDAFYRENHFVSEEKAQLSIDIAKRERELLKNVHYDGGYSLYIGIPFCPTTCLWVMK